MYGLDLMLLAIKYIPTSRYSQNIVVFVSDKKWSCSHCGRCIKFFFFSFRSFQSLVKYLKKQTQFIVKLGVMCNFDHTKNSLKIHSFIEALLKMLKTLKYTYGIITSVKLPIICWPTIMMTSWIHSSTRQPWAPQPSSRKLSLPKNRR